MLTQIGKRMLTLPFPFSRLSDQSKQRLSTCAVGTFVLAPLFPSACNRETSSKCKKGSFLRVLPRKSRHVTKTTLSFTDSACQESDSLPTASFPLFSPLTAIDQAAEAGEGGGEGLTLGEGREDLRTSAPPRLLFGPRCLLLVSQQRFTTCWQERRVRHLLLAGHQAFSGKTPAIKGWKARGIWRTWYMKVGLHMEWERYVVDVLTWPLRGQRERESGSCPCLGFAAASRLLRPLPPASAWRARRPQAGTGHPMPTHSSVPPNPPSYPPPQPPHSSPRLRRRGE